MAQLKEGSVIKKSTGDEIIATVNDLAGKETITGSQDKANQAEQNAKDYTDQEISSLGGESIVDLGTFNDQTEAITYLVMNQLPTGHYTYIINGVPGFLLLELRAGGYAGTLQDSVAQFLYFEVSIYGEIQELKTIDLRDLGDVGDLDDVIAYIDSQDELKADKTYVDSQDLKQMPISGGVLENYREKLTTVSASGGSIDLSLGNVFVHTPSGNRTYSITDAVSGQAHSFTLIVNMGSTVRTLTFPSSVKWQGGEIPDMNAANKTYVLTFMTVDGGANWLGIFGGEF